ncbi:RagB/SusD family nutrient uptake outer membrane protein [Chitinophaga pendula]|uniref:RagB/SusD family nutrient uptake outer membrane protein n=1 Tax=Chitinophaga TaxID=79328 RepID=UPI000BAF9240|nr:MULTISPECIES: RagB/SusD family nutrient uptake outer membrane protein [Chitinophaga]ASZ09896.1 hypothetical protein CK934_02320 [Chitinophaga sp. MD30]UCJ07163.1 RagB/SusD family nutrient uptake outer membrane protein [Chitinophaga pendula]
MKAIKNQQHLIPPLLLLAALICCLCASCKKFLEERPQDEQVPANIKQLEQLLLSETYPLPSQPVHFFLSMLDDDVKYIPLKNNTPYDASTAGLPAYSWDRNLYKEMKRAGAGFPDAYTQYYNRIKGANAILDVINKVAGDEKLKMKVEGEARILRAYYYFMLVNLYAAPYNDSNNGLAPGVPLILSATIKDALPPRNTVGTVYQQIVNDVRAGCSLLEQLPAEPTHARIDKRAAWLIAGRIFLYMEKWEDVIYYTDLLLKEALPLTTLKVPPRFTTLGLAAVPSPTPPAASTKPSFLELSNEEILFYTGSETELTLLLTANSNSRSESGYYVSDELEALYESTDLRPDNFFAFETDGYKVNKIANTGIGKCWRLAEAYLNRAEAAANLAISQGFNPAKAIDALNQLRSTRFNPAFYQPLAAADFNGDMKKLLQLCKEERRRELCFEEHRWFDLRRWQRPAFTHTYKVQNAVRTFRLQQGANAYLLPIPDEALANNPSLTQNP